MKSFKAISVNLFTQFIANTFIISITLAYVPNDDSSKKAASNNINIVSMLKNDEQIAQEVIDTLLEDNSFKNTNIKAKSVQGIVTLTGDVSNYALEGRAIAIAEDIVGVKGVTSELEILP
jgi:osmotically-inducible protein OsmY